MYILHQFPCVTGWMPRISDQIVHMINHVPIGSDDGHTARNSFHVRRVISSIKSIWIRHRACCGVVWQERGQCYFWVCLLRINDRSGSQFVKAPIVSSNELCDAKLHDLMFNSSSQIRIYFFICLPVSDEKAALHYRLSTSGYYNISLLSRNSYCCLIIYHYRCSSGIYELSSNCAETDLQKETSVQKLCCIVSHAR